MNQEDYFGYISLDDSKQAQKDEIILERRGANDKLKSRIMRDIAKREIDYVVRGGGGQQAKTIRLERALEKAYEWQNTLVQDFVTTVNDRVYVGPHKWIICILGDDVYAVNQFKLNNRERLLRQQNVSISIMTMSAEVKDKKLHSQDYYDLTELTKKGLFVNIVEKQSIDEVTQRFLASMDVFHSSKQPVIKEFFGGL